MVKTIHNIVLFCCVVLGATSAPTAPKDVEYREPTVPSSHSVHPATSLDIESEKVRSGDVGHDSHSNEPLSSGVEDADAALTKSLAGNLESFPKKKHFPKMFKGIENTLVDLRESSAVLLESSPKKKSFSKNIKKTISQLNNKASKSKGSSPVHFKASSEKDTGAVTFAEERESTEKMLGTIDKQGKSREIFESALKEPLKLLHRFKNHKQENSKEIESRRVLQDEGSSSWDERVKFLSVKLPLPELEKDHPNKENPIETSESVINDGRYKSYRYDPETGNFVEENVPDATEEREAEITYGEHNDLENEHPPNTSQKEDLDVVREELKKIKSQYGGLFSQSPLTDYGDKAMVKVQVNKNGVSKNYIYSPGKAKVVKFGQFDKSVKNKGEPKEKINIEYKK